MKKIIKLWPIMALIMAALAMTIAFNGCKSTPPQVAYRTAGSVQVSVEAAMAAWNIYVGQYHPPLATELQVKAAYQKYQQAMTVVCDAGAIYAASSVTNTAGQTGAAAALDQARSNAAQSLGDLVGLLRTIGVKV
jgi:hypothetical protein